MDERKVAVTCDNYYANGILLIEIAQRMHATNRFASDGHTEKKKKLGNSVNITHMLS